MKRTIFKLGCGVLAALSLTGCVGSNAVTAKLMKFNLEVVDNRYARGGVNFLLMPVYGITTAADYIIFNSIGFWTGTNPLNGKSHIFDSKADTMFKVNESLDPSLRDAPLSSYKALESGSMKMLDASTVEVTLTYSTGELAILRGVKQGDNIKYYMDGKLVADTSIGQLQAFAAAKPVMYNVAALSY